MAAAHSNTRIEPNLFKKYKPCQTMGTTPPLMWCFTNPRFHRTRATSAGPVWQWEPSCGWFGRWVFKSTIKKVRRAGLDYWHHLDLAYASDWEDLQQNLPSKRVFFFSRFATQSVWDAQFEPGDAFVFGRETSGLPESILDPEDPRSLRLPTQPEVRSLNLATTVGIVLYEQLRQLRASS